MKKAPDFSLPDQTNTVRSLADFAGRWLVLYFYPEDDTPGCTAEACEFRDSYAVMQERGLAVVGVSSDSVKSHAKFAQKYHLNFPILADESGDVQKAYGAWDAKELWGVQLRGTVRTTVLINPAGEIARVYPKVTPKGHAEEILKDYEELR